MDTDSKLVITWDVSTERGLEVSIPFMADLRSRIPGRVQITTDGLLSYADAVERVFGSDADYAQDIGFGDKRVIQGDPDPARISTTYVERHNLTTRMSLRRFARRSNGHSKRIANHAYAVAMYLTWFNFCRLHMSLPPLTTPAMASGLAEFPHDMLWLASLVE